MEEKKLDVNSIIGFVLIFAILVFMMYQNQPSPEEVAAKKAEQEQVDAEKKTEEKIIEEAKPQPAVLDLQDSTAMATYKGKIGAFGYTAASDATTVLENNFVHLTISNKGGQIIEAKMKNFVTYDSVPVYLVKDGNASFG